MLLEMAKSNDEALTCLGVTELGRIVIIEELNTE